MTHSQPPASTFPAEVVPRPDRERYRRRWLANAVGLAVMVAVAGFGMFSGVQPGTRWGMSIGGIFGAVVIALAWAWQQDRWLRDEPSLILRRGHFRILHKGEQLWIPWIDVADLAVVDRGIGPGRVPALVFHLRPGALTILPARPAPLLDRFFQWGANELAYARPAEQPPFNEVAAAAADFLADSRSTDR